MEEHLKSFSYGGGISVYAEDMPMSGIARKASSTTCIEFSYMLTGDALKVVDVIYSLYSLLLVRLVFLLLVRLVFFTRCWLVAMMSNYTHNTAMVCFKI